MSDPLEDILKDTPFMSRISGDCVKCKEYRKRIEELEAKVSSLTANYNKIDIELEQENFELQRKYDALVDGLKAEIQLAEDDAVYFEREAESGEVEVYKLRALLEDE